MTVCMYVCLKELIHKLHQCEGLLNTMFLIYVYVCVCVYTTVFLHSIELKTSST